MKSCLLTMISLAGVCLPSLSWAEPAEGIRNRPTQAELASRVALRGKPLEQQKAVKMLDPESIQKKERGEDLGGLLERSTILFYGGNWTLVPRGAVLYVPLAFGSRVSSQPVDSGRLLPWSEFYARNKGWILQQSVAITEARGESSLSEEVLDTHRKVGRVVVAVLHNGPISVRSPLPEEENNATQSELQSQKR